MVRMHAGNALQSVSPTSNNRTHIDTLVSPIFYSNASAPFPAIFWPCFFYLGQLSNVVGPTVNGTL